MVKMPIKMLSVVVALAGVFGFSGAAGAQQFGTADQARALLARAAAAVKADEAGALAAFNAPNGSFRDGDLYVFCFDRSSGTVLAGPPTTRGRDVRTIQDPTGKPFGHEMFANVRDSDVIAVDYMFPRPDSTVPVPKESFVEGLGNVACGVGYYIVSSEPMNPSRTARVQHACTVIMGLDPSAVLYATCIRSLDRTLARLGRAQSASTKRDACIQAGLQPGTPSFASCVETGPGL
jgi:Cache domain